MSSASPVLADWNAYELREIVTDLLQRVATRVGVAEGIVITMVEFLILSLRYQEGTVLRGANSGG